MKKILSLITLIGLCACVYAEDWQRHDSVYVDNHSVSRNENSVQGWVIRPQFEKSRPISKHYIYEAAYVDAKCTDREMAILNTAWYNKWHQWEEHAVSSVDYVKVYPKTNNEQIFKALCTEGKGTLVSSVK